MADNDDIIRRFSHLYETFMEKHHGYGSIYTLQPPRGPLYIIAPHNDTFLHMAAQSKEKDLVLDLLNMLPADIDRPLSDIKNNEGNTILHEVATSDTMIDVAKVLLRRNGNLLFVSNDLGEKPIFCAARYGQTEMFEFLADKMGLERESQSREESQIPEASKAHLRRNDGTTVLHISIASECFGLALFIVKCYPYLIEEKDQFSMTALQYMACNPTIFRKGRTQRRRGFIEHTSKSKTDTGKPKSVTKRRRDFIEEFSKSKIDQEKGFKELIVDRGFIAVLTYLCEDTCLEQFKMRDERKSLEDLILHLVSEDTSWDASINFQVVSLGESEESKIEEHSNNLSEKNERQNYQESSTSEYEKSNESPLFLATISNIKEIINGILFLKPQTLTHTNKEGMNILHVAILYRHIDIFDMVVNYEVLARKLLSGMDKEGNSILHMVSQKRKSQASEKMQNPAIQLQDELLLFEKVKSASKMLVSNPRNKANKTAEELFAASNEELHQRAKEWLMRTTENCTILSVFIATVAFAAAYTVPGGPNQDTGIPILHSKPFFVIFIIADVISLTLALTSVGIFLSILTSSFLLEDFKTYLFKKLKQGIICLVLSVSMMAVAFGATIVLIMKHHGKIVVWDVVAFLPVPIFFLSYSPLRSAVLGPCREWFMTFVHIADPVFFTAVSIFFFVLPCGVFEGLRWTLKKACDFICKTVPRISWKKSQPKSHTQSPTAPPTQV